MGESTYVDSPSKRVIEPFYQLDTTFEGQINVKDKDASWTYVVLFPEPLAPTKAM